MLSVVLLSVVMLSVVMLSVVMLSVLMLNVVAPILSHPLSIKAFKSETEGSLKCTPALCQIAK